MKIALKKRFLAIEPAGKAIKQPNIKQQHLRPCKTDSPQTQPFRSYVKGRTSTIESNIYTSTGAAQTKCSFMMLASREVSQLIEVLERN